MSDDWFGGRGGHRSKRIAKRSFNPGGSFFARLAKLPKPRGQRLFIRKPDSAPLALDRVPKRLVSRSRFHHLAAREIDYRCLEALAIHAKHLS